MPGCVTPIGVFRNGARDAEVAELDDVVSGDEDIGRLDVAVQEPLAVREREAGRDLGRVIDRD